MRRTAVPEAHWSAAHRLPGGPAL